MNTATSEFLIICAKVAILATVCGTILALICSLYISLNKPHKAMAVLINRGSPEFNIKIVTTSLVGLFLVTISGGILIYYALGKSFGFDIAEHIISLPSFFAAFCILFIFISIIQIYKKYLQTICVLDYHKIYSKWTHDICVATPASLADMETELNKLSQLYDQNIDHYENGIPVPQSEEHLKTLQKAYSDLLALVKTRQTSDLERTKSLEEDIWQRFTKSSNTL